MRLLFVSFLMAQSIVEVTPIRGTDPVSNDPDDPAIWVNRANPSASLILGTNKVAAPGGALVVFGLDGKIRQTVTGIDRPNNVDIEYGLGGLDIAVVTERRLNRLRVFSIAEKGVRDLGFLDCCPEPMGIGLYKRPRDGAVFAIVAPKGRPNSPRADYLYQYRLTIENGAPKGALVRRFGQFSGTKEIEAVVVDDALGFVYCSDEGAGIRKYHADPDHPEASKEVAMFGLTGFRGDREGLAIYAKADGSGYLIATDQLPGNSEYHVYDRRDNGELFVFRGGADTTDGIDITSANLGPEFPTGLFVAMNSGGKNFLLYDARTLMRR
ncbi:MAG: phytase [Bryobacteraceae bacterium]|nr:phytase [Bryobacteraceae bacterium]